MLGRNYEQTGNYQKAVEIYEELYNSAPSNYVYFESLNRIYLRLKDYEASIKLINIQLKNFPNNINLYGLLGSSYYLKGEGDKSHKAWDKGIALSAENESVYRTIANYAIERRNFDKAIEILEKGKSISETPLYFSYQLAELYGLTMDYKNAAEEYASILINEPAQMNSILNRILNYSSKPDALSQTIEVMQQYLDDGLSFHYILARLFIESKEFDKALQLYVELDKQQKRNGADIYNYASLLFNGKEYDVSSKAFKYIIDNFPSSPLYEEAKLGYAKTLEAKVNTSAELPEYNWLPYKKHDDPKKYNEVIAAYTDLITLYKNTEVSAESYLRIGNIYFHKLFKPERAKEYFSDLIKKFPLSKFTPAGFYELGNISLANGKIDDAIEYFSKVKLSPKASDSDRNKANFSLAKCSFYNGQFQEAKKNLDRCIDHLNDNSANDALQLSLLISSALNDSLTLATYSKGELLTVQKKFDEALKKFDEAAQLSKSYILRQTAQFKGALMNLANGNFTEALKKLSEISDEGIQNIYSDHSLFLAAKIHQYGFNEPQKAVEFYEKLLAKFPNSLYLSEARREIIHLRNKNI